MADITQNQTSFQNLSYSISIAPIVPILKLEGFGANGFSWDKTDRASVTLGADGLVAKNVKPTLYTGTFDLQPNSNARVVLDQLLTTITPQFGIKSVNYVITLTEDNLTTGLKTIYTNGTLIEDDAGNTANLNDGQSAKQYKVTFSNRQVLPI